MGILKIDRQRIYSDVLEFFRVGIKMIYATVTLCALIFIVYFEAYELCLFAATIPIVANIVDIAITKYIDKCSTYDLTYDDESNVWTFSYVKAGDCINYVIVVQNVTGCKRSIDGCTLTGVFDEFWYRKYKIIKKLYIPDTVKDFSVFYKDVKDYLEEK